MRLTRLSLAVAAVTLVSVLAGCGGQTAAPDAGTGTIKIAVASKLAGHWPLWSGIRNGIFQRDGFTVEVSTIQTDSGLVQALQSESVDLIIGTVPQVVQANDAGADIVGIAAVQNKPVYRMIAGKDIRSVDQLRGRKVGVSEVALGIDSYLMKEWLATNGLPNDSYQLVATGGAATRVASLSSGGVEAIAVPPPGDVPVIDQGYTDLGFATRTVQHLQWTMLVTGRETLQDKGLLLRNFVASYVRASRFLHDPANRQAAESALIAETNSTPAAARAAYDLMIRDQGVSPDGRPDETGIAAWEPLLGKQDLAPAVFDGSLLPQP